MAEERQDMPQEEDVLRQLGIDLPTIEGMPTGQPSSVVPTPVNIEELADVLVATAILSLEQALSIVGYTSEKGRQIAKALDSLVDVVGEDKIKEVQMMATMGGMPPAGGMPSGGMPPTGMPF